MEQAVLARSSTIEGGTTSLGGSMTVFPEKFNRARKAGYECK